MSHDHVHAERLDKHAAPPFWRSRYAIGFLVLGAVAVYFLLSEHRAHFFGALPFLLLLACPLMHLFMHGKHGGTGAVTAAVTGTTPTASRVPAHPSPRLRPRRERSHDP